MSRLRMRAAAAGATAALAVAMTAGAGGLAQAAPRPAETPLPGSAVPFTSHTKATGYVAGSQHLTIQLWLRPDAAAQRYATAAATPGSALFHHYLGPAGYTARFAASRAAASQVGSWLRGQGFTGITTDTGRAYVRATAPVSTINAAFGIRLTLYKPSASVNAGRYPLRANNRAVSLPATVAARVLGVSGLDNANPELPMTGDNARPATAGVRHTSSSACSHYYGQHTVSGLPEKYGTTTFPTEVCGYSAGQLRAAYGASNASTGKGQTTALVELGLTKDMFLTLQDYAKANHMPAPSSTRYTELSLGKNTCGDPFDGEEQLDVESAYDMAPGASQLVVGGDSCNDGDQGLQGLFDADTAILNGANGHPLASIASNSWESGGENQPASFDNIENGYLVRATAEGVGMYFSSGDGSGVEMPSSDPYATAVGGTTVGLGASNNRLFETGWSTGFNGLTKHNTWQLLGEQGAVGGGPSLLWRQPAYQKGVVPAALATAPGSRGGLVRSAPDISADADPYTGMAVGLLTFPKGGGAPTYGQTDIGGTSLASPLVAGVVTAAQQGQAVPFGFLNPVLYQLHGTNAYYATQPLTSSNPASDRGTYCPKAVCGLTGLTTFDDQNPNMFGYTGQVTLPGYDNMSGLGTPNGPAFIQHLRELAK
ncbi:MAG TPA: protease pro-enzyme activation domain-containing protein [Streptosporangiaceae bacterium]